MSGEAEGVRGEQMKKNLFRSTLCAVLFALCVQAQAQQAKKIPQIGLLAGNRDGPSVGEFQRGLRDLGYVEGKNILVEVRYAEGKLERISGFVDEFVQLKVDVLVSGNYLSIRTAKQVTKTIPIVMVITEDPVATGLVDSLARPGGNVTGLTMLTRKAVRTTHGGCPEVIPRRSSLECGQSECGDRF